MSETFGVWELRSRLGQNELGDTHLAVRADGVQAVIKRIRVDATDERVTAALKQEVALAAQLDHPSAARILEQGEVNGVPYVAIEHVLGLSLARGAQASRTLSQWPLPFARAAQLVKPVLDALAAAHALTPPLLHRELVPENVRIDGTGRVVLTDFGFGRARLRAGGGAGMRAAFVSPEQARGNTIDARSEVFTAGLMLFELACGRLPAQGAPAEVVSRIATGELDAPLAVNPQLDPAAAALLQRALALRPEDRFATAADFAAALAPLAGTEPLGAWATQLAAVPLPAAAPAPKPKPAVAPAIAAAPAVFAKDTARPAPKHGWRIALGLAAAGLIAVSQLVDVRALVGTTAADPKAARPLELVTIPSGAQVYVDGFLEDRRTPLTLHLGKDELRNLVVKKPGLGSWSGIVYNSKRLEITLATGAIEEERYEGGRPAPRPPAPAPPPPAPTQPEPAQPAAPPKAEVVFDVESPPIEIVLTAAHSVRGDLGPALSFEAGTELVLSEGASLYYPVTAPQVVRGRQVQSAYGQATKKMAAAPGMPGWGNGKQQSASFRRLNLFALHTIGGTAMVSDLSTPMTVAFPGKYFLFTPNESGELTQDSAWVRVDGTSVPLTARNLLHVDAIDSFLVRVLQPKVSYRLELSRADGTGAPLPPVILSMRPDRDPNTRPGEAYESSIRYDGAEVESGQVLVGPGVHSITGARSAWFTIVTADGVEVPDVKLSIKPMQGLMPKSPKRK